jgi:signal transduction histidine kinase
LLLAQAIGLAIALRDRSDLLLRAGGAQSAQRIADTVRLLESLDAAGRQQVVRVLSQPPLVVQLDRPRLGASEPQDARAAAFAALVRRSLGEVERQVDVLRLRPEFPATWHPHGPGSGAGMPMGAHAGAGFGPGHSAMQPGIAFLVQVALRDGALATFDARQPEPAAGWPLRLLAGLAVSLAAVLGLSLLAVRWITRPLKALADAADDLGRDIHRAPLPEAGPAEVARAAHAFNAMQARLLAYLRERTSLLAAMSHDLKTPVTRLRLRAELLPDPEQRRKFTQDLQEMDALVAGTLDYLRGEQGAEPVQPVDLDALLESVQADLLESGGEVRLQGHALRPYPARPAALKRCLRNLLENAVRYGGAAEVELQDGPGELRILVRDRGPGLPPQELARVFEPFHRVEGSRSRDTGGTGLGLTIARSLAELHGGRLELANRAGGGLEARLTLPRP